MKFSRKKIIEILIILLLGFVPLLWFKGQEVILGHDAGLTLAPVSHFLDRLYSWTDRFAFGSDQSFALPGFFIHGIEALVYYLTNNLQIMQKIIFIFWFVLPGLTMYYFVSRFEREGNGKYLALPAAIFYMFNHFLLQGWFIAERTKFSLYAALPLVISFLFDWEEDKRSSFKTAFLISITLFFLNGGGSLPLFGGLLVSIIAFAIFYLIYNFSKKGIVRISKLFFQTIVISGFLNAYWILPYFYFVKNFYSSTVSQEGGINGILGWINYVSSGTSLGNLLRLQGVPEWYQNPLHPYANYFLTDPLLLLAAALLPVFAFFPLYIIKNKSRRKVLFFTFLALFSLIFVAGSQPPFGIFYILLIKFIPGFIVFRTPFYKFAPALWFSYAVLIGFSLNYFSKKLEKKNKLFAFISMFVFCLIIIFYNFPFLNGMFFDYIKGMRSMRVTVPAYVFDFGKWSESSERIDKRTLALPEPAGNVDAYKWGYWSLAPLTTLLTNAPIINESGYTPPEQNALLTTLYQMMRDNKKGWQNLAKMLGIKSFLLRNDFDWNLKGSLTASPDFYRKALDNPDLVLIKKFGEWSVYDFKDNYAKQKVEVSRSLAYIVGNEQDLGLFVNLPVFNINEPVYLASSFLNENLINMADLIYLKPECEACNLSRIYINTDLYMPLLIRSSIFYPLITLNYKLEEKSALKSDKDRLHFYLYDSLKKILSLQKIISQEKSENIILKSIDDYYFSLKKLKNILLSYLTPASVKDNQLLMEFFDFFRIERSLVISVSAQLNKGDQLDSLYKSYLTLTYLKEQIGKNVWQTVDENHKRLLISSPKNGEYDMLYNPNDPFLKIPDEVIFSLDGTVYKKKPEILDDKWWSLGKFDLQTGKHYLEIEQPATNLYTDSSLDLPIFSSKEGSCIFSKTIENLRKDDIYRISFLHQRTAGDENFTVKIVPDKADLNPFDKSGDILRSTPYWNYYEKDFAINEDGESFRVAICSYPTIAENVLASSIQLKDINIRKIAVPDVIFYSRPGYEKPAVKIVSKKKSQVEYDLMINSAIQDKFLLTLNETYHPGWKLNNLKISGRFMSNGYANGWIVDGADKEKTSITYTQQDLEKYGFLITAAALLTGSILILFIKSKGTKNSL